jgi:hypothetical protein
MDRWRAGDERSNSREQRADKADGDPVTAAQIAQRTGPGGSV